MSLGIVDTTVIVHLYRRDPLALNWYSGLSQPLSLTPITWMEIIYGAGSKAKQVASKTILSLFQMEYLTPDDQIWAMTQMETYRLSDGVGINDCLIASVAHRLQLPIFTHNQKDFLKILPTQLVIKPY